MRFDGVAEALQVVAAFEDGHEAALCMLVGNRHHDARQLGERDWQDLLNLMDTYRRIHRAAEDAQIRLWA